MMNLGIKSIVAFLMAISVFTSVPAGCNRLPEFPADEKNEQHRESSSQPAVESPAFRDNVYHTVTVGEISSDSRMVFDSCDNTYDGISDNSQPFESNMVYFKLAKGLEGKYPVTYTGYLDENGQQTVLCSKSGCRHTGVDCPAYINMRGDFFTLGGKVYFYSPEYHEYGDDPMDGSGKRIRLFEITEDGKKLLCEVKDYTGDENSSVITDGKDIYFTAKKEGSKSCFLMKIETESGKFEQLAELDEKYAFYKLSDITADGKQIIYTACEKPEYDYIIGVYNITTGENIIARKVARNRYLSVDKTYYTGDIAVVGRKIYNIDSAGRLSRRTVGASDVITIFDNLNNELGHSKYFRIMHTYDDKLVINRNIDNGKRYGIDEYYVLDTETMELSPLTLIGKDSGELDALYRIYAVTPDYFLVATNPSRRHHSRLINDMALISKADFYSSKNSLISAGVMYAW